MTPVRAFFTWVLLLSFICGGSRAADDDRISSDRPDFLTSPEAVGKGRVQLEFGPLVQRADAGDARTRTVSTPTLVRLGLTDVLELRLETDGRLRTRETDLITQNTIHAHGYADASVGIKWKTHEGDPGKGAPSIGWVFTAELPSGSRAFRGRGIRPAVVGLLQFELPDDRDFSVNAGVKYDNDDAGARFISGMLGAGITQGLGERLSVTAEVVAQQIARQHHGGSVVTADFAVAYLLTRNVQVDALVGRGLTSESPKYLFTTGISARF